MKIAICFSGGIRNYKDTYPYFKTLFQDVYNSDIFIYGVENKDGYEQNVNDLWELYKPKKQVVNTINFYKKDIFNIPEITFNTPTVIPMWYNVMMCNQLKKDYEQEQGFVYDIVIRSRLDNFFVRQIHSEEFNIENNTILIPAQVGIKGVHPLAERDGFAIGRSAAIDLYADVFSNIRTLNCGHPETLLGLHIKNCNLTPKVIDEPVSFTYPENIDIGGITGHTRAMWRVLWDREPHYSKFDYNS